MATSTPNLGLLKKDPVTDGKDTYNIKTMLNDNWDKLDADSAKKALKAANPIAGNLAALDAAGNPIDSGKKAVDFEAAGAAQSKIDAHNQVADAHSALFAAKAPAYTYGTTDLTAGTSPLETGKLYFVYE